MRLSAASDVGRWRQRNEDAYWAGPLSDRAWVLAVADGMGGHQAGDVASRVAIETLRDSLPEVLAAAETPASGLREAIERANQRILDLGRARGDLYGMGTTLTVALIEGLEAWIGHVGDSRAYLIRDSEIVQLTEDHSIVGELIRSGTLDETGAMVHPQRNLLTRALGAPLPLEVDVRGETLRAGDVLVLASDGLTSLVSSAELMRMVRDARPADFGALAERLVALANERGGYDNITAVLARVEGCEGVGG
ncbi:MAG: Stp1/IreP family PP2C-type Ser/Thr phosphatase [Clostridia bacterium]|nr:Stp1/IreP family PP2C-type Ser/Thr phosphatase [Clostridia bacterium]